MATRNLPRLHRLLGAGQKFALLAAGVFVLLLSLWLVSPAKAGTPTQETEKYCLSCHGNPDLKLTLPQ